MVSPTVPKEASKESGNGKPGKTKKVNFTANVKQFFFSVVNDTGRKFRTMDGKALFHSIGKPILQPKFIEKRNLEVTRTSQWLAALFIIVPITISLALIVAIQQVIVDVFLQGDLGNQTEIMRFVVTAIGLGMFAFAAWLWFLFVKTGGFGLFAYWGDD